MNKIVYNNFAPKAAENAALSVSESSAFQCVSDLADDADTINYATFENRGINLLDVSLSLADESDFKGFVSKDVSDSKKLFSNGGAVILFNLINGYYSGPGITLHFHQHFCTNINIKFFRDSDQIFSGDFQPYTLDFFCEAPVEKYNKIIITFISSETPYQFVKLRGLDFGNILDITEFFGAINIFEELEPDCSDLPFDTCDFEAIVPDNVSPQVGQSFYVFHGSQCFGKFTADKINEDTDRRFVFEANDDKYILSKSPFPAFENKTYTVGQIVNEIYANSDISIDCADYADIQLKGFIESKNCRYTAAMLSMGGGFFISSARNKKLRLFKLHNRKNEIISANRILGKAEYIRNAPYTSIVLFNHKESDFNNDTAEKYSVTDENIQANIAANVLSLEKYSLFSDPNTRLNEIASIGFSRNEIHAQIILGDEKIGDVLSVETHYGLKTGILKSLDISINGSEITAKAVFVETEVF